MANERNDEGQSRANRGLVIVFTGDGKGKTTAALGTLLRAWGHGLHECVIQFIKDESSRPGEVTAAEKLGIEWHVYGDGFTWQSEDLAESQNLARLGWSLAQQKISSGDYDLIILDEFTYAFTLGWLDIREVIAWLREHKPAALHLIVTGRGVPPELVDYADLVTEMTLVKHPFDQGLPGQKGIEF
jgi:cob(I)alamin adenosyltransferase